jgi:hypothetical protein
MVEIEIDLDESSDDDKEEHEQDDWCVSNSCHLKAVSTCTDCDEPYCEECFDSEKTHACQFLLKHVREAKRDMDDDYKGIIDIDDINILTKSLKRNFQEASKAGDEDNDEEECEDVFSGFSSSSNKTSKLKKISPVKKHFAEMDQKKKRGAARSSEEMAAGDSQYLLSKNIFHKNSIVYVFNLFCHLIF